MKVSSGAGSSRRAADAVTAARPPSADLEIAGRRWRYLAPEPPRGASTADEGAPPTFSVVIAAHDVAGYIGEAVASALTQSVPPLEVIVCDDGSSDDLEEALEPYRDEIVLLRQRQRGVGAAKAAAAAVAEGDFIAVLDADDTYEPQRLELLGELAAARPDLDLLTSDGTVELDGRPLGRFSEIFSGFEVERQRERMLEVCYLFPLAAIRRSAYEAVGGFDPELRSGVDWDLWIRLMLTGSRAGHVTAPLATYRIRPGSVTSDTLRRARGHVRVLEKAAANPAATSTDRQIIDRSLRERRRQLVLTEFELALLERRHGIRRRALSIALAGDLTAPSRAKVALAALAPEPARRYVSRRERRVGRSRLGRPVTGQGGPAGSVA
jgi:glycosyltransferase involved in cell wall biosynthesis